MVAARSIAPPLLFMSSLDHLTPFEIDQDPQQKERMFSTLASWPTPRGVGQRAKVVETRKKSNGHWSLSGNIGVIWHVAFGMGEGAIVVNPWKYDWLINITSDHDRKICSIADKRDLLPSTSPPPHSILDQCRHK